MTNRKCAPPCPLSCELSCNFTTLNIFLSYKKKYSHVGNVKNKVKSRNKICKRKKNIKISHATELEMKKKIMCMAA